MKAARLLLPLLGLLAFSAAAAIQAAPEPALAAIQEKGRLLLSEGGTWYLLNADGSFYSGPWGLCGETIGGTWTGGQDGHFLIRGTWAWMNGTSALNDVRILAMDIGPGTFRPRKRTDFPVLGGPPVSNSATALEMFDGSIHRGIPVKESTALPWVR